MKLSLSFIFLTCFYAIGQSSNQKEFTDVTITESTSDDPSEFANILLDTLVKKRTLDEATAVKILATFDVKGVNRDPESAQPYTKATINKLVAKGDADAAKKFINRLRGLFDNSKNQGERLIEYLLELVLDNGLMDAKDGAELAANNGYGVNIEVTRFTSSTQEISGKPKPISKGCCAKDLTPFFEVRIDVGRDHYYFADVGVFAYYMNTCGGCRRYINGAVARVASSMDACGCSGVELVPVYHVYKAFVYKSEHDHIFTTDLGEIQSLRAKGYNVADTAKQNPNAPVAFYCAKTQGQCGATEPLLKYSYGHLHYFTTNQETGNKWVAGGWKADGALCYVWPNVDIKNKP